MMHGVVVFSMVCFYLAVLMIIVTALACERYYNLKKRMEGDLHMVDHLYDRARREIDGRVDQWRR